MKGFSIQKKKTPFQRHKELEEEKKRKAEEEAAKVYEEFVDSFGGGSGPSGGGGRRGGGGGGGSLAGKGPEGPKVFLRGGTVLPGSRQTEPVQKSGGSGKYVPPVPDSFRDDSPEPPGPNHPNQQQQQPSSLPRLSSGGGGGASASGNGEGGGADGGDPSEQSGSVFQLPSSKPPGGKVRNIDKMLEQLKKEQEAREERERCIREGRPLPPTDPFAAAFEAGYGPSGGGRGGGGGGASGDRGGPGGGFGGSFDEGDPFTTNLYVGNLAPDVTEQILAREFGRFGPIASIKIMWPRTEEQRRAMRNCGFVAYMTRADAEKALRAMNGLTLHEYDLRIGWGKSVPLPAQPLYDGKGAATGPLTAIIPAAKDRPSGLIPIPGAIPSVGHFPMGAPRPKEIEGVGDDVEVLAPQDPRLRFVIDSMALYVLRDGCEFEQLVMSEKQGDPEFAFLFALDSREHAYYRWRVYSLAEGDTLRTWRMDPFQMVEGGQRWLPPAMLALDVTKREGGDRALSDLERDKWEDILRGLTADRSAIRAGMVFALDHAEAATEVVEVLQESLMLAETPAPVKVARLFLASDILHNSTAPVRNASRYRARLEAALPDIFESMQVTYRTSDSRMTQETLRRHVLRVLRCWRERFLFNDEYLGGLQASFLKQLTPSAKPRSKWDQTAPPDPNALAESAVEGLGAAHADAAVLLAQLRGLAEEEVERRCRVAGLSVRGGRWMCIHRLLALDAYLHGGARGTADDSAVADGGGGTAAARKAGSRWGAVGGGGGGGGAELLTESSVEQEFSLQQQDAGGLAAAAAVGAAAASQKQQQQAAAAAAAALPLSRWTVVLEEEEAQPLEPISKRLWEQQRIEAEEARLAAERAAAAEAAAAERAARAAAAEAAEREEEERRAAEQRQREMDVAGAAADEERRAAMRKIEVQLLTERERLEEQGVSALEIEQQLSDLRSQLLGDLAAAGSGAQQQQQQAERRRLSRGDERGSSRASEREREREREPRDSRDGRGGESSSHRERDRDRDRDREERRKRSRSRSRERGGGGGSGDYYHSRRRSSRSRSRDRSSRREAERSASRRRSRSRSRSRSRGGGERGYSDSKRYRQ